MINGNNIKLLVFKKHDLKSKKYLAGSINQILDLATIDLKNMIILVYEDFTKYLILKKIIYLK